MHTTKIVETDVNLLTNPSPNNTFQKITELSTNAKKTVCTHPDTHGNALLLLHRLITSQVFDNKTLDEVTLLSDGTPHQKTAYKEFVGIYNRHHMLIETLKTGNWFDRKKAKKQLADDILAFKALLEKIDILNPNITVRLLGDLLADRGENDYFTLLILNHLKKKNVSYEIIFSNHDAIFLEVLEKNLLSQALSPENCLNYIGDGSKTTFINSINNLRIFIENKLTTAEEIKTLAATCYKPALKLVSYEYDQLNNRPILYSHAGIDPKVLECGANALGVPYLNNNDTPDEIFSTIDLMNKQFNTLLSSGKLSDTLKKEFYAIKVHQDHCDILSNQLKGEISTLIVNIIKENQTTLEKNKCIFQLKTHTPFLDAANKAIEKITAELSTLTREKKEILTEIKQKLEQLSILEKFVEESLLIFYQKAPLIGFIWPRPKMAKPSTEENFYKDLKPCTHWETFGWEATALNIHGHASQKGTLHDTENPKQESKHHWNQDTSNLGKLPIANYDRGKMLFTVTTETTIFDLIAEQTSSEKKSATNTQHLDNPLTREAHHELEKKIIPMEFLAALKHGQKNFRNYSMLTNELPNGFCKETIKLFIANNPLNGVKLSQSLFDFLYAHGVENFSGADLSELNLSELNLRKFNFLGANLKKANLTNSNIQQATFENAQLENAAIHNIQFDIETNFKNCRTINEKGEGIFRDDLLVSFIPPGNNTTDLNEKVTLPLLGLYLLCKIRYQKEFSKDFRNNRSTRIMNAVSYMHYRFFTENANSNGFLEKGGFFEEVIEKTKQSTIGKLCLMTDHALKNKKSRCYHVLENLIPEVKESNPRPLKSILAAQDGQTMQARV